ncbi:Fungal Zn(2)-Cys(6) binuclear cluster domain-containing protein 15 [Elsinoe fawcettii]|nr:Fungal Zn(2)-Cys(6) binuclear cluster domain-containing protein 15 [Elsinoe fawcettii]
MASPQSLTFGSPQAKRTRILSKVCDQCKQKKARCDSGRPQCEPCRRKGTHCVYREKGQPGLRPGFGKAIEKRLDMLEGSVKRLDDAVHQILEQISSNNGDLQQPATILPHGTGAASMISPWNVDESGDRNVNAVGIISPGVNTSLTRAPHPMHGLPNNDIMSELVGLYQNMLQPWLPLVPSAVLADVVTSPDKSLLRHAIVVVAFRFWTTDDRLSQTQRQDYIEYARDHVLRQTLDICTVDSTQALTLLAVDTLGSGTGPRAWNILSMLVAAVRHLNITRISTALVRNDDRDDEVISSNVEKEEKRRLYWTIVLIDRFCSTQHGQAGGLQVMPGSVPYPASSLDMLPIGSPQDQYQDVVLGWQYLADVLDFMSSVNQLLIETGDFNSLGYCQEWQSKFRALDLKVTSWYRTLPHWLKRSQDRLSAMYHMIHAAHCLIRIRMYTVAAFPSTETQYLQPSIPAQSRCLDYIGLLCDLTSSGQPEQVSQMGPFFAFVLWVASRSLIIIHMTTGDTFSLQSNTNLDILTTGLQQLAIYWPCAQKYLDLIQTILDAGTSPGGPQDLDAFRDTKKTTYGLERRLHMLKSRQINEVASHAFDFLDMPLLEMADFNDPWLANTSMQDNDQWLATM